SIDLIRSEIVRIADEGPTSKELESAKKFLIGSYALRFDTSAKIANQLVQLQLDHLGADYISKRNAMVAAVTEAEIRAAAKSLFGEGDLFVVAVGKPTGLPGAVVRAAPGAGGSKADAAV
ncbi:MAG TPA: insulinase family protein, partial [Hansschlegelia sp.]